MLITVRAAAPQAEYQKADLIFKSSPSGTDRYGQRTDLKNTSGATSDPQTNSSTPMEQLA